MFYVITAAVLCSFIFPEITTIVEIAAVHTEIFMAILPL